MDSASVTRTLRRKTEKVTAADAPNHDAVDEVVNRTRSNKGKVRAVDILTIEDASVDSKRRRDEDVDVGDVPHPPLDPGPSHRPTKRTRQKMEVPVKKETKKAVRKPWDRQSTVPARSSRTTPIPGACDPEEPTLVPSLAPSTETLEAEEPPVPQVVRPEVVVKQKGANPSHSPCQQRTRLPAENAVCKSKRLMLLSPLMIPGPFVLRPQTGLPRTIPLQRRGGGYIILRSGHVAISEWLG